MLILASQSPRRRELLSLITRDFVICPSDAPEMPFSGGRVDDYVKALARDKARFVAEKNPHDVVLGADTVVALKGTVLGKPRDRAEAIEMLGSLSGNIHSVFTGVCVMGNSRESLLAVETKVKFRKLSREEISDYVAGGEPLDKAGAYGIQGGARGFVEEISGDYFNVVGLPMKKTFEMLTSFMEW